MDVGGLSLLLAEGRTKGALSRNRTSPSSRISLLYKNTVNWGDRAAYRALQQGIESPV